jgi:predicted alpha/beta-hydrolase family hydrolase
MTASHTLDEPQLVTTGPPNADWSVVLAHGAGAGLDSDFMQAIATGLADQGLQVIRFEFPYMVRQRREHKRRPPDGLSKLRATWLAVISACRGSRLVIGGKSLGGRIASLVADESDVHGLLCLGYPFHPAGRPERQRIDHLRDIRTPTLIVQGDRDALGNRGEIESYPLSTAIRLAWLEDGDHSFKPRKASGYTQVAHWQRACTVAAEFVASL